MASHLPKYGNVHNSKTLKETLKENAVRTDMMTVAVRINTDDYGSLFETCLGTEPVQTGFV